MTESIDGNNANKGFVRESMEYKTEKHMSIFKMGGILIDLYAGIILFAKILDIIFEATGSVDWFIKTDFKVKLLAACASLVYGIVCLILKKECSKPILIIGIVMGVVLGALGIGDILSYL